MGLFETYFVWFGQVLAVSVMKTLVIIIRHRCVQVVKSQPYQGSFQNTQPKMETNIRL